MINEISVAEMLESKVSDFKDSNFFDFESNDSKSSDFKSTNRDFETSEKDENQKCDFYELKDSESKDSKNKKKNFEGSESENQKREFLKCTFQKSNSLKSKNNIQEKFILIPFYFGGKPLSDEKSPRWGMTLLSAGTMRFRWNEKNENRDKIFEEILESQNSKGKKIVPIELIHSKIVVEAKKFGDTKNIQADGIVTKNRNLIPAVTVADCVPIFLYDTKTGALGVFHSGWKGTGIAENGVKKMAELYGSKPEDICAAIGPHIQSCCYNIDEERAKYFIENFGKDCVSEKFSETKVSEDKISENELSKNAREVSKSELSKNSGENQEKKFPYALSLTQANLFVLKKAGIKEENIVAATDCTCCTKFSNGKSVFGSFRRQAASLPPEILKNLEKDELSRKMTVQAAFVI
ncbi:MAG: polyphenol oxidase family protein [Treponema sp.]|nr:polyphenol oxidase family protein [Treponema sp.]